MKVHTHFYRRGTTTLLLGLALILLVIIYTRGNENIGGSTLNVSSRRVPSTSQSVPSPSFGNLLQPGLVFVGQVGAIVQIPNNAMNSDLLWSFSHAIDHVGITGESFYDARSTIVKNSFATGAIPGRNIVTLKLPPNSFPGDQLKLIAYGGQLSIIESNEYIRVMAMPNNDEEDTYTAQRLEAATGDDFRNQQIEYRGSMTISVTCQAACADLPLAFVVGRAKLNFLMSTQTIVIGFGSPVVIMAGQTVGVIISLSENQHLPFVVSVTKKL